MESLYLIKALGTWTPQDLRTIFAFVDAHDLHMKVEENYHIITSPLFNRLSISVSGGKRLVVYASSLPPLPFAIRNLCDDIRACERDPSRDMLLPYWRKLDTREEIHLLYCTDHSGMIEDKNGYKACVDCEKKYTCLTEQETMPLYRREAPMLTLIIGEVII